MRKVNSYLLLAQQKKIAHVVAIIHEASPFYYALEIFGFAYQNRKIVHVTLPPVQRTMDCHLVRSNTLDTLNATVET